MRIVALILLIGANFFGEGLAFKNSKPEKSVMSEKKFLELMDSVRSVMTHNEGYQITFKKHAGIYYLKSNNPRFKVLESHLKEAETHGKSIKLRVESSSLEILDSVP